MYEKDIVDDLDYKSMHKQLLKMGKTVKEQTNCVITSSAILELGINQLVDLIIKKIQSPALSKWTEKPYVPINNKLITLRFGDIISEDLFENMNTLFKVRNQFAHRLLFSSKDCNPVFAELAKARIKNKFLSRLPNDIVKFQLLSSQCSVMLFKISEKIDPNSVMHLEATDEITFEPIE